MDIRNTIQHYISVYDGSEERVIDNTACDCRCKKEMVKHNIDWLIRKGYIEIIQYPDMTEAERTYYDSDLCTILRNIRCFDEAEYYKEERERKEIEDKLPIKDKIRCCISQMENEFDRKYLCDDKNYTLIINDDTAIINIVDENRTITIDFTNTSDWNYNEQDNSVSYKINDSYYTIELECLWGKRHLKHYK
ncbi:MAG: hypothetical protein KBT35_02125 [Firmicutes bacterium]|nr:hypothetical protein [Candidatus Colivicinus equi]